MGTSSSSSGPGAGVALVPPWVSDPVAPEDMDAPGNSGDQRLPVEPHTAPRPPPEVQLAPPGRFRSARTGLGKFAGAASSEDMRRGIGHYVRTGYGGSRSAAGRMGGTARTAAALYGVLSAATEQKAAPGSPFDPAALAGRSDDEIMDTLVEAVRPIDGTQDAEATRKAIRDAISELLGRFPNADLLALSEEHCLEVVRIFLALDIYNRFVLDVGKAIQQKTSTPIDALSRLKDIKDYIKETVSARFRERATLGLESGALDVNELARRTIQETFEVFEEYVE